MKLVLKTSCFLLFIILMLVLPISSYSQEVEIINGRFELSNTSKYKMKRVKKVEVISTWDTTLCWMIELDTAGKILKQGKFHYGFYHSHPNFIVEESFDSGNVTRIKEKLYFQNGELIRIEPAYDSGKMNHKLVKHYFQNQQLVKLDTTVSEKLSFHYNDTATNFTRTVTKIYKRGDLINQQNKRLNDLYLNQPIGRPTTSWEGYDTNGNVVIKQIESEVYFKTKIKDDYDTTKIYLCGIESSDDGFWALYQSPLMKFYKELHLYNLKKSRVIANYKEELTKDCFVEGECFEEPKSESSGRFYFNYGRRDQDFDAKYKYSTNKKGLHKDVYCMDCYNFTIDKRYRKGKKTKIYTFKYTYFE